MRPKACYRGPRRRVVVPRRRVVDRAELLRADGRVVRRDVVLDPLPAEFERGRDAFLVFAPPTFDAPRVVAFFFALLAVVVLRDVVRLGEEAFRTPDLDVAPDALPRVCFILDRPRLSAERTTLLARATARSPTARAPPTAANVPSRAWSTIAPNDRPATSAIEAPASSALSFVAADCISAAACSSSARFCLSRRAAPPNPQNSARSISARYDAIS